MRTATYARYSTDRQRDTSIDDQERNCQRRIDAEGWRLVDQWRDRQLSGSLADRPGYADMRAAADSGQFDVLLVDDLSRLSRDSVELGQVLRRLAFHGIRVVGVSDGYDSEARGHKLQAGVRGLLNEVYLDDLRDKTHRGLSGQALRGFSAGGRPYGYRSVPVHDTSRTDAHGDPVISGYMLEPDPDQANVVRRIFHWYGIENRSPRWIANQLNAEHIPSPRRSTWAASAIYGHPRKGTGILNNEMYRGRYTWNRSQWMKDPETGKRKRIERPQEEWITEERPELRIVSDELWDAAKSRQSGSQRPDIAAAVSTRLRGQGGRRPTYLFSGMLQCGCCGGNMVVVNRYQYGCSRRKERGAAGCSNDMRVAKSVAEARLLEGIKGELLTEDLFRVFEREARRLLKERQAAAGDRTKQLRDELQEVERSIENVMAAIRAGVVTASTKAELEKLEKRQGELAREIEAAAAPEPDVDQMLPAAKERFRQLVTGMEKALVDREEVAPAREQLKALVGESIQVAPDPDEGCLVAMLSANPMRVITGSKITLVAGAGFGRCLTVRIPLRALPACEADSLHRQWA